MNIFFFDVGCETFADGSSIIILDVSKFDKENSEKEIDLGKTRCRLWPNKLQYLHNGTWKKLKSKNNSVAITVDTKVSLQVSQAKLKGRESEKVNSFILERENAITKLRKNTKD